MDKMQMQSIDLTAQNVDKIAALFPNCVTEAADENGRLRRAINFDMLRQMLSGEVIEPHVRRCVPVRKKASIGTPRRIST